MKLLYIKITDPAGFRSLQPDFEYRFRTEWTLQNELDGGHSIDKGFAPFVCAGPNGSGKSNLLEALAAIFFQLEVLRVRRDFLPANFLFDEVDNPKGFKDGEGLPNGFELEYLIQVPNDYRKPRGKIFAHVQVLKELGESPKIFWRNFEDFEIGPTPLERLNNSEGEVGDRERDFLLPEYVLGYSSGENEILSLPFFKMRFIQFDEYWDRLTKQTDYAGKPETRLAYMDSAFSQAILLCNLLYHDADTLKPFQQDIGLGDLKEFRILIKQRIEIDTEQVEEFAKDDRDRLEDILKRNPALTVDEVDEEKHFFLNIVRRLEEQEDEDRLNTKTEDGIDRSNAIINKFRRCATSSYVDEKTDILYLDFFVDEATKQAFSENFEFEVNKSPIALFQAFQVLLNLNLYSVSASLKTDLYHSNSHYVSETVPVLASDERIMRFKFVQFAKDGIEDSISLKDLSDGEHQLLHSLGLCLLFKDTNSLFLLDEPETHFNPSWRANFISRLRDCFPESGADHKHEMLISTHTPFLISDSERHKVLMFEKDKQTNEIGITHPEYNTLGASINKITIETLEKRETIGGYAERLMDEFRKEFRAGGVDIDDLIQRIDSRLGESVEKLLLIKTIADSVKD